MDNYVRRVQELRIGDKYSLIRRLGGGAFGAVYLGKDIDTGKEVALKLEHHSIEPSSLKDEVDCYECLSGIRGFPEVYWFGWKDDYKIMAFELFGPSLADLFRFCGKRFSLKTTLLIFDQLLVRFESLHSQHYVHRDVKPENFLVGIGKLGNLIYMTDFGLAVFRQPGVEALRGNNQVLRDPHLVGTARYASISGHMGRGRSPRDDLESLGYMMVYFMRGQLPWQGLKAATREEKDALILSQKQATSAAELCAGLPAEFADYMDDVSSLGSDEMPDHARLRERFRELFTSRGYENDDVFDWTELACQY